MNRYKSEVYPILAEKIGEDRLLENAPMKEYTSFRAGGNAALLVTPACLEELKQTLKTLSEAGVDFFIMGNGTNLLVKDGGYDGVIVKIGRELAQITVSEDRITAEAGALLKDVADAARKHGLAGFEFASGIPGSLGGAVFMNAGAYGGEMSKVVERVHVLSRDGEREYTLAADEMHYGYRKSALMEGEGLAVSAVIRLARGDREDIAALMEELNSRRKAKQPLQYPSAGSFFKRPPGNFAGKLIQEANLMGVSVGGARISTLHAGFLINEGGATAADIINLMETVQNTVYERTGIRLEPEVRIIGEK